VANVVRVSGLSTALLIALLGFSNVYLQFHKHQLCFVVVALFILVPMFPVSLDCPFLIVPSVFFNVYLHID
jgi:hypothetical protein